MQRQFTLRRRVFTFHGIQQSQRERWTRVLLDHDATVLRSWRDTVADTDVFVITDYWVDKVPSPTTSPLRFVTPYWLHEMLRTAAWLPWDAHPFFSPPAALTADATFLSYPLSFEPALASADGTTHYVMLPCSPLHRFSNMVPLWPYMAVYLRQPTRTTTEFITMLQRYVLQN
jgi:hypothetical protein